MKKRTARVAGQSGSRGSVRRGHGRSGLWLGAVGGWAASWARASSDAGGRGRRGLWRAWRGAQGAGVGARLGGRVLVAARRGMRKAARGLGGWRRGGWEGKRGRREKREKWRRAAGRRRREGGN
jgi:hypothetical protein